MILTSLETVAYRVHVPRWSFDPVSGAGAARFGGRLNRPGVPALYLSHWRRPRHWPNTSSWLHCCRRV
ncbi:RES domain-containing protein [Herbaspirillum huttiense]|uniref:RES domain-containing protein n=1 Tax=Herbaspirillum huttiense TaxID=863372 RepID=UPI0023F45E0A|nr:RES domain-containing protein [Herbaspirillum huttiense]